MSVRGVAFHPEFGTDVDYEAYPLSSDPDTQVAQTIQRMRRHVLEDSRSAPIQRDAAAIQASGSGDALSDSFWWVKDRVGFRQDEALAQPVRRFLDGDVVEVLIRPRDLSQMADSGIALEDCDGFASYLPALVLAQGGSCRFVTVAADGREPGRFSHVYAVCRDNSGQRVSLDASHGSFPGWECTSSGQVTRLKEWNIDGPDWLELGLMAAVLLAAAWAWGLV